MSGVRPADYPPPFTSAEALAAPTDAPDERIDVGILIVGAGPGGLACAVRLGQLLEEHPDIREQLGDVPVAVLEKGKQPGSHLLSGAVMNPRAIRRLFAGRIPIEQMPTYGPVHGEAVYLLTKGAALRIPPPPTMMNHGNDVEIGANTCIDRGALDDTVIEDGVKLDNLIQVAHNVHIGAHTAMAAMSGIAGSTRIGSHCTIGGAAGIVGHIQIADHVHLDAATVVTRSITKPGRYSGVFPFDDNASWEKNAATLRQLYALRERLRALEKKS